MPHDANGQPLSVGDRVTMEFRVQSIQQGEDACNVSLEAVNPDSQNESYLPNVACNSRLTNLLALLLAILFLAFTTTIYGQSASDPSGAPGVAASAPFSKPLVVASRENLVPFSSQQLADLGYSLRSDQATGRSYWAKAVNPQSSFDQVLSLRGECADGSCESSTVLQPPGGS